MDLLIFNNFFKDLDNINIINNFVNSTFKLNSYISKKNNERQSKGTHKRRFNPLKSMSQHKFKLHYRFDKKNMRNIIELIRDDLELDAGLVHTAKTNKVPLELQVMAAIRCWGRTEHPQITASVHGVTTQNLTKICNKISKVLAAKASRYIRMPTTLADKEKMTNAFKNCAALPNVIGVVAHTHVRVCLQKVASASNGALADIQLLVDADSKIHDIDIRLQQSAMTNPNAIFNSSRIKERFEQNEFRGRLLLANNSLPCNNYLFTPIYLPKHPRDFAYNKAHAATYSSALKCVELLKQRFGILKSSLSGKTLHIKQTLVALALLHNLAIEWHDNSLDYDPTHFGSDHFGLEYSNPFPQKLSTNSDIDQQTRAEFIRNNF